MSATGGGRIGRAMEPAPAAPAVDHGALLALRDVTVAKGRRVALVVPRLEVQSGEVLAVLGPNGAGKSTLLRVLALLEPPTRGQVEFRGRPVGDGRERLGLRRRMASVFQEPLLCDTTVAANARLALTFRGLGRPSSEARARQWLDRLGIGALAARPARTLSGGEAQRVSLARAFAAEPEVLFLDEPFAALDPPTRERLLDDLGGLLRETRTTTVFVTHDRAEVLRLADRVAVLIDGRLAQVGAPESVYGAPVDEAVARLVGVENLLVGSVSAAADGVVEVSVQGQRVTARGAAPVGEAVLVALRPEDVLLEPADASGPTSARNRFAGTVETVTVLGAFARVVVAGGPRLAALVTRPSVQALALAPGRRVRVSFKATAAHVIRRGRPAAGAER